MAEEKEKKDDLPEETTSFGVVLARFIAVVIVIGLVVYFVILSGGKKTAAAAEAQASQPALSVSPSIAGVPRPYPAGAPTVETADIRHPRTLRRGEQSDWHEIIGRRVTISPADAHVFYEVSYMDGSRRTFEIEDGIRYERNRDGSRTRLAEQYQSNSYWPGAAQRERFWCPEGEIDYVVW
ncbi:MAG TPA: hypothetical protein VFT82_03000 [Candidatus Paceibacterota bacterium]|nr:hypothetical protein [Candidatus Paceibacterota bacterium]